MSAVDRLPRENNPAISQGEKDFRHLPVGAELRPGGGVHVRVWAPQRRRVAVVWRPTGDNADPQTTTLTEEGNGYFSGLLPEAGAGIRYGFRLDDDEHVYPDPVSRFQPDGPHDWSEIVDPSAFPWTDGNWPGVSTHGQVIYEMHIGTFTQEGTWEAASRQLARLAETGITLLEVMPVCDFPGRFGWGYDGVNYFAPSRLYGSPDDFRRFVDAAHGHGLGVILDVVYNHAGPDGNYLPQFAPAYFSQEHETDWGQAINFDGPDNGPVREYFLANAAYWIDEFHLDGLRIDATQDIYDESDPHILAEVVAAVRKAAGDRGTFVVAENEPQDTRMLRPIDEGGFGMDAAWNDDFHHTAMVRLTGRAEAYYTDYKGSPQEFISAIKYGFLYQGQWYDWQSKRRGTVSTDLPAEKFVTFIQNHDQIANTCRGLRAHAVSGPGVYRAMTALMLLGPNTPMLFQGQEFNASNPFFYFADHREDLAKLVHQGRQKFMSQFPSLANPEVQAKLPDPADPATFLRSKLDHTERDKHAEATALYRDLLALRRDDPVFSGRNRRHIDGAVLEDDAFVLRYFANDGDDRLVVINFGPDLHLSPSPEPLLAPPTGRRWDTEWSSEDFLYGGSGTAPLETDDNWRIPGQSAVVLRSIAGRGVHAARITDKDTDKE